MKITSKPAQNSYFQFRNVSPGFYRDFALQPYLINILPRDLNANILDIGCGFGQVLFSLKKLGYNNISGVDINDEALSFCIKSGLNVFRIKDIIDYASSSASQRYDFIIMSHVLEHLEKNKIIETLQAIRQNLLAANSEMVIMVPNAQANTGCYWAYEDFTHTTLFTAGSLFYVLRAAGFETITLIDPYCLENLFFLKRLVKKFLLRIYIFNNWFWNKVTSSAYHKPSPQIFSHEIKVLAR